MYIGDVWEIWGEVFRLKILQLGFKCGRGMLAKTINMTSKIVIFKLKNIDLCTLFG